MSKTQRILLLIGRLTIIVVVIALFAGAALLIRFRADQPVVYTDDVEHFKYGSLGSEHEFGVPYWIWRALPELFADKLPGRQRLGVGRICF